MTQAEQNRAAIADIRARFSRGAISYHEAKAEMAPILFAMNARAKELAKEHGVRYKPLSFSAIMR